MLVDQNPAAGVDAVGMSDVPDPEVSPRAKRRTFTAAYKKKIVAEYEAAGHGERGALLRREGLYSSVIGKWREQSAAGAEAGLQERRRGPKPDPSGAEAARLRSEVQRLEAELAAARRIVDVQAKLSALLEDLSKGADSGKKQTS